MGAAQTAPALLMFPDTTVEFIRINTTAFTSGVPQAIVAGFNQRVL